MEDRRREAELLPHTKGKKEELGGYKDAYQRSDAARALRYDTIPIVIGPF
jgi:hypothetical protein